MLLSRERHYSPGLEGEDMNEPERLVWKTSLSDVRTLPSPRKRCSLLCFISQMMVR